MAKIDFLTTVVVDEIPETLENGVLYVSSSSHVALHSCCCGCGEEVVSPLVPTEYKLSMKGPLASIWPSIGNHDFPCGSHYIIKQGQIIWAGQMSRAQIEAGRAYDRHLKRGPTLRPTNGLKSWIMRIWKWLAG